MPYFFILLKRVLRLMPNASAVSVRLPPCCCKAFSITSRSVCALEVRRLPMAGRGTSASS